MTTVILAGEVQKKVEQVTAVYLHPPDPSANARQQGQLIAQEIRQEIGDNLGDSLEAVMSDLRGRIGSS